MGKYSVAFLMPCNTVRILGSDGWEFESDLRIPVEVEALLKKECSTSETTADYSSYEYDNLKVGVIKDADGAIENIYFRFYGGAEPELPAFLSEASQLYDLEFFIPQQ